MRENRKFVVWSGTDDRPKIRVIEVPESGEIIPDRSVLLDEGILPFLTEFEVKENKVRLSLNEAAPINLVANLEDGYVEGLRSPVGNQRYFEIGWPEIEIDGKKGLELTFERGLRLEVWPL